MHAYAYELNCGRGETIVFASFFPFLLLQMSAKAEGKESTTGLIKVDVTDCANGFREIAKKFIKVRLDVLNIPCFSLREMPRFPPFDLM